MRLQHVSERVSRVDCDARGVAEESAAVAGRPIGASEQQRDILVIRIDCNDNAAALVVVGREAVAERR